MFARQLVIVAAVVGVMLVWGELRSADGNRPKPSTYAPAKDLVRQAEALMKRLGDDLANEAEYGEDQKGRVAKDSNTLVVIAQVLGMHDEQHAWRAAAASVMEAAHQLASSSDEYAKAKAAYDQLAAATKATGEAKQVGTEPVAEIGQLMKQVPIVNNTLRRGVTGNRFAKTLDANAGQAATLAAIAELSSFDKSYCSSDEERALWEKVCAEMRDAAGEVVAAIRKEDQAQATAGLDKLVKTCDACHEKFRK